MLDFKASDHLIFDSATSNDEYLDHGQVLDKLDVNNDGWLGAKDVEAYDYDNITVHVGANSLELDVFDTSVVLHGMTKASQADHPGRERDDGRARRALCRYLRLRRRSARGALEGPVPALHRVRQGPARDARRDRREQAAWRGPGVHQEPAGPAPAAAAENQQRADRLPEEGTCVARAEELCRPNGRATASRATHHSVEVAGSACAITQLPSLTPIRVLASCLRLLRLRQRRPRQAQPPTFLLCSSRDTSTWLQHPSPLAREDGRDLVDGTAAPFLADSSNAAARAPALHRAPLPQATRCSTAGGVTALNEQARARSLPRGAGRSNLVACDELRDARKISRSRSWMQVGPDLLNRKGAAPELPPPQSGDARPGSGEGSAAIAGAVP